ncbi:hypothetical protein SAMN05216179_0891 [Gracilibacillus kekensis]|uniref:Uncharacterized protein n=1 Tax=Gracilibacillus kekensis TaxID=1027249 RepID=A0A1M7KZ87_9BACI|nr:hypothetical protein SAMN05216179_0891 [Gracilibacillus kekensis]
MRDSVFRRKGNSNFFYIHKKEKPNESQASLLLSGDYIE